MAPISLKSVSSGSNHYSSKISPAARIKVIGVGGAGGNAVKRMIESGVQGVEFWAMNTDAQVLKQISGANTLQLGANVTRGLGAGMSAEVGRQAAEETVADIENALSGADMIIIAAGMGGGTGTGAGPVVAEIAKRLGILTVGVVTKPFDFEGIKRRQNAEEGIERLKSNADAVIVVPNQRLLQMIDKRTSFQEAFKIADDILVQAVQGIADLINVPGDINVDFADVRAILSNAGTALIGMGRASGNSEDRARKAAMDAIQSPLLEIDIRGAKGVLLNIQGGKNLSMSEIGEAASLIQSQVDPDAKIIFGTSMDPNLADSIQVVVIATGFAKDNMPHNTPSPFGYTGGSMASPHTSSSPYTAPRFDQVNNNSSTAYTTPHTVDESLSEMELPAFLRRKLNQDE